MSAGSRPEARAEAGKRPKSAAAHFGVSTRRVVCSPTADQRQQ